MNRISLASGLAAAVMAVAEAGPPGAAAQAGASLLDLQIRAGTVSDQDSQRWLVGTWEPDADLGLPPGANTITYLDDGFYLNPFRGSVLVGIWSATANTLTMTPLEMRNLESGQAVPELMQTFSFIKWNEPTSKPLIWLSYDRFQEGNTSEPRRRRQPVFDFSAVRSAVLHDRLVGLWTDDRGVEYAFKPYGTFTEAMSGAVLLPDGPLASDLRVVVSGTYGFDRTTQALLRRVTDVTTSGITLPATRNRILERGDALDITRRGDRQPAPLRWLDPDRVVADAQVLRRRPQGTPAR
jgi:hypothetical protein